MASGIGAWLSLLVARKMSIKQLHGMGRVYTKVCVRKFVDLYIREGFKKKKIWNFPDLV